jgi:hypothetical protein
MEARRGEARRAELPPLSTTNHRPSRSAPAAIRHASAQPNRRDYRAAAYMICRFWYMMRQILLPLVGIEVERGARRRQVVMIVHEDGI